jgi:hypothetical protein
LRCATWAGPPPRGRSKPHLIAALEVELGTGLGRRRDRVAAQIRMRPILMTSFAFIFGVLPLAIATGAAAEMRQALGTAVFFGMIGVTFFGLIFTPVFYVVARRLARN